MARRRRARAVRAGARSRRRRSRRNPAGGFLPAIVGFAALPMVTHLLASGSTRLVPADGAQGVNNRAQVFDVAAAILAWAGRDRVKDPGYRSLVTGGMWGAVASAVLRPVVLAILASRGELPSSPLPVVYQPSGPAPLPAPNARPQLAEADDEAEYAPAEYVPNAPGVDESDEYDYDDLAFDALNMIPGVGIF